ncbi:MAG: hypothetical protein IKK76_03525 [Alphaproteobacteria bacterium]|nr:hypothetical protein [Alphaproteobacteria bacterium]
MEIKQMKNLFGVAMALVAVGSTAANADYSDKKFRNEIGAGLDLVSAEVIYEDVIDAAPGELGQEVYEYKNAVKNDDMQVFVPTSHYVRMGAGLNLGFATDKASDHGMEYEASGGYTTKIGLGWNLSSYVRTEVDFQNTVLKFSDLDGQQATYKTLGGMLYFDLARRYVQSGDITRRRTFVPFMGLGAGVGAYDFEGRDGADGFVIATPRAELGFNLKLNELIGIDIAYQYQMMIGHGFGWDVRDGGTDNISNIMATIRAEF